MTFSTGLLGVETNIHTNETGVNPTPGRVSATFDNIYFTFPPNDQAPECDFNGDQYCDGPDIDQLMIDAATGGTTTDLNDDGVVDNADRDQWLVLAGEENGFGHPLLVGDSDLNGTVDAADLNALAVNWQNAEVLNWTGGNFTVTGDPGVNAADLNAIALNWPSGIVEAAVPEPSSVWTLSIFGAVITAFCRKKNGKAKSRHSHCYRNENHSELDSRFGEGN